VRIERLSQRYWQVRFDGARRLATEPDDTAIGAPAIGKAEASSSAPLREP
jgi:hypothetical protein